jgi:glycosyltransferase involved in cell wall biosynthesis
VTTPRVSIVLPTYNGARFLAESVDSCLAQTFTDFELVVVVDGSTDHTVELLGRYHDPRLRVLVTQNQGLPSALNTGFAATRGPLLSWTSDDNLFLPDALAEMVRYLDAHPAAPMVCTDCLLINDTGATTGYSSSMWASFLYRREAAEQAGPYRPEFRLVEDVDFFLRLQHHGGPIERISTPLYKYRVHDGSLSATQLHRRHMASLRLHYDLVRRGIEGLDLEELFVDRLRKAAMHRDAETLAAIVAFARTERLPFADRLDLLRRLLETPPGWLANRLQIAVASRVTRARQRLGLLAWRRQQ